MYGHPYIHSCSECSHRCIGYQRNLSHSAAAQVEGRLRRSVPSLPAIKLDRLKTAKALVEKAVKVIIHTNKPDFTVSLLYILPGENLINPLFPFFKLRKVFSVQGPYPVIRAALWARGWVERHLPHPVQRAPHYHGEEEEDGDDGDIGAAVTGERSGHKS